MSWKAGLRGKIFEFAVFESEQFKAKLEPATLCVIDIEVKEKTKFEQDLTIAAEMKIILQGALDFYTNEEYSL